MFKIYEAHDSEALETVSNASNDSPSPKSHHMPHTMQSFSRPIPIFYQ